jgi:hypothetical protein
MPAARHWLADDGNSARVGTPLVLDVRAPPFDSYAYVDYFTAQGEVLHLYPNDRDALNFRPARNGFVLGRPPQGGMHHCWKLDGQTGEQMITYVASSDPLFATPRPASEGAKEYLDALSGAVKGAGKHAAKLLFFDLQPAGDGRAGGPGCTAE